MCIYTAEFLLNLSKCEEINLVFIKAYATIYFSHMENELLYLWIILSCAVQITEHLPHKHKHIHLKKGWENHGGTIINPLHVWQ